jgi:amino acid transporter
MRTWNRRKWTLIAIVGISILVFGLTLDANGRSKLKWTLLCIASVAVAITFLWVAEPLFTLRKNRWKNLPRGARWLSVSAIILVAGGVEVVFDHRNPDNRFTDLFGTGFALLLWGAYCALSRGLDALWLRFHKR